MKKIILIGLLLILSSCSSDKHEIVFVSDPKAAIGTDINTCEYVESVDGIEVTESMIDEVENQIIVDDVRVSCGNLIADKIETKLVQYAINGTSYDLYVKVVDEEAPVILIDDHIEVEEGNEYFDLNSVIKVSDNYDKNCTLSIDGDFDIDKIGKYQLKAVASDINGNESEKEFTVEVVEKEKEIVEVEVPSYSGGSTTTSRPSSGGSSSSKPSDGNSGSSKPSDGSSSSSSGSSGSQKPSSSSPYINGVRNISIAKGSSMSDMIYELTRNISASSSVTVDYTRVNLSVAGSYPVYYYGQDGASASCTVTVN